MSANLCPVPEAALSRILSALAAVHEQPVHDIRDCGTRRATHRESGPEHRPQQHVYDCVKITVKLSFRAVALAVEPQS